MRLIVFSSHVAGKGNIFFSVVYRVPIEVFSPMYHKSDAARFFFLGVIELFPSPMHRSSTIVRNGHIFFPVEGECRLNCFKVSCIVQ